MNIPGRFETSPDLQKLFAIPSVYFWKEIQGIKVADFNHGSEKEQRESLETWYSLGNINNNVNTFYAETLSPDQDSVLSLSLKNRKRQLADYAGFIRRNEFQILTFPCGLSSYDLETDFYHYPCNPNVDVFKVATLVIDYMKTLDFAPIRNFLSSHKITTITEPMCQMISSYNLFFLLTRFMGRPVTDFQIELSLLNRDSVTKASYDFLNSVYHREETFDSEDKATAVLLLSRINEVGNSAVMDLLETPYIDWTKKGYEYLARYSSPEVDLEDLDVDLEELTQYFQSLTDLEGEELMTSVGLEPSSLGMYISRRVQKESFANLYRQKLNGQFKKRIFKNLEH